MYLLTSLIQVLKRELQDDNEIQWFKQEKPMSFDYSENIFRITPTALYESTALKNMHYIKTLSSEEGKTSWINDEPRKPASTISK